MATTLDRLRSKYVETDAGCWQWTAAMARNGYGSVWGLRGRVDAAHRVVYEVLVGPIPKGLELDHLCRNRACVNPAHLEPVDRRTNSLRGVSFSAVNAAKTECPKGHPYDEVNTYLDPAHQRRHCRICMREANRAAYRRRTGKEM